MSRQMTIAIGDEDADAERLEQLSSGLRRELLDLGVDDVAALHRAGETASPASPPVP